MGGPKNHTWYEREVSGEFWYSGEGEEGSRVFPQGDWEPCDPPWAASEEIQRLVKTNQELFDEKTQAVAVAQAASDELRRIKQELQGATRGAVLLSAALVAI